LSQTTASVYDNYYVCNSHGWNVVIPLLSEYAHVLKYHRSK